MLQYALVFLIIALICGVVGFSFSLAVMKISFVVFLVLFVISLLHTPRL